MEIIPFQKDGFDEADNPIDFIDIEDGYTWIYQATENEIPRWMGIPPED